MKKVLLKSFAGLTTLAFAVGVGFALANNEVRKANAEDYWTVTLDPNGGTIEDPDNFETVIEVEKGQSIDLPYEGISFGDDRYLHGWAYTSKGPKRHDSTEPYTPTSDITLYAFSVSYNENPDPVELEYVSDIESAGLDSQYIFSGFVTAWYDSNEDGTSEGIFYIADESDASIYSSYLVNGANAENVCVWDDTEGAYVFSNEDTFLTDPLTSRINIGSKVTMLAAASDESGEYVFQGCVLDVENESVNIESISADVNGETEISFLAGTSETYTVDVEIFPHEAIQQGFSVAHASGDYLVDIDGSSFEATNGYGSFEVSTITSAGVGSETIRIASDYASDDIYVDLTFTATEAELLSVSVSGTPATQYANTAFDPTGLTFTGTYSVGDPEELSSDEFSFSELNTVGDNITVTATHSSSGLTCQIQNVTVLENSLTVYINGSLTQTTFTQTGSWNHDGLVASGTYANGESYLGEFIWSYSPSTPAELEVGDNREVTITATAEGIGSYASKVCEVTIEKCVDTYDLDGKSFYIKSSSYYLSSSIDESSTGSAAVFKHDGLITTFEIVGDNTFKIKSGNYYLSCNNDNDGLRLNSTQDTWTVTSNATNRYTLTNVETGRVITQHNGNWKTYLNSSQGDKNLELVEETVVPTSLEVSGTFKTTYYPGQAFSSSGMVVNTRYSNDTTANVPLYECDIEEKTFDTVGTDSIKVSTRYHGVPLSYDVEITVLEDNIASYEIVYYPSTTVYHVGDTELDLHDLKVQAVYDSGKTEDVTTGITFEGFDTTQASEQVTITIKVNGVVAGTFDVVVKLQPYKTALHIRSDAKNQFFVGDTFSYEGLEVEAFMSEGDPVLLNENQYEVIPPLGWNQSAGIKTVTIRYLGNDLPLDDITYPIYVNEVPKVKTLDHITVSGNYQTSYVVGDTFSTSGLVVTAYYVDNNYDPEILDLDDVDISSPDMSTVGVKPVTVSYTFGEVTKTATFNITVTEVPKEVLKIEVTTKPTKTKFTVGDNFSANGIAITVTYVDNTTSVITDSSLEFSQVTFSGYDMLKTGSQTITVTYQGKTASYAITVSEKKQQQKLKDYEVVIIITSAGLILSAGVVAAIIIVSKLKKK